MARADDEAMRQAKAFLRADQPDTCPTCGHPKASRWTTSKGIINAAAFARLVQAGFDARPADVPGSYASRNKRKARLANASK